MQTKPKTSVPTRFALAILFGVAICPAQQQNVGAVGRGVSISFQNASGSSDRGVSVGFHDAAGTIQVTTNLAAATFTITGPNTYVGNGTSFTQASAPAGTYKITYDPVNCYSAPASETRTLTDGGALNFSPGYYQGRATITVGIAPLGATSATFSINPPVLGMSNTGPYPRTQANVLPQAYTMSFNPVAGFTPPATQTLGPNSSCRLDFVGTYVPAALAGTATLSVSVSQNTNSSGKFTIADTQGRIIATSVSSFGPSTLDSGKYTIKYAPLAGFYTPPDHTVLLNAGDSVSIQGKYRRLLLIAFTGWNNSPGGAECTAITQWPGGGVRYVFNEYLPGITKLLIKALAEPALKDGISQSAFTFYTTDGHGNYLGDACTAPSLTTNHLEAGQWIAEKKPTADDVVAVVGHSYGGNRARLFVEQLMSSGTRTMLLATVDPIDWKSCSVSHNLADLVSGCNQTADYHQPSSAEAVISAYQIIGEAGFALSGYIMPDVKLTLPMNISHSEIDDADAVHRPIIDALSGLIRGPKTLTATIAGAPSRGASGQSYPVRVTAAAFGKATGFGKASGVKVKSASLNGIPAMSVSPSPVLGDIASGSSSSPVTLLFPTTAAAKGSRALLTVTFENSDGTTYTNSIRQVAP